MQYVKVKRSWMVSMADALRTANGSNDLMYPSQMLAAALAVEGGGTGVTVDKSLTKSGAAADAAAVGEALAKKANISDIPDAQAGLIVQFGGGASDTSVADIKTAYKAGQMVYAIDAEEDCYATLQTAEGSVAVFIAVDTAMVRVYTVNASDEVTVVSKALISGGGGNDVYLAVDGNKYTLTIDDEKTSWTIPDMPTVTTSDAGKILMVNDSGTWAATAITNAEEVAY